MKKNNPVDELKAAIEDSPIIIRLEAGEGAEAPVHVQLGGDILAISAGLCMLINEYLIDYVPKGRAEVLKTIYEICKRNLNKIEAEYMTS